MKPIIHELRGREVTIRVRGADVGLYPEALSLNPSFQPELLRLKLQLDIDWDPPAPAQAIQVLEMDLAEVAPSLKLHQCRGQSQYRLLSDPCTDGRKQQSIEADLALAHLIEHVIIDLIAFVTDASRISGATGAPVESDRPFDLFVECPDEVTARMAIQFALCWTVALVDGNSPDGTARAALAVARQLYRIRPQSVSVCAVAKAVGYDRDETIRTLKLLEQGGFACPVLHTMNFSGVDHYRVSPTVGDEAAMFEV